MWCACGRCSCGVHVVGAAAGATQLFPRGRCACGRCCSWCHLIVPSSQVHMWPMLHLVQLNCSLVTSVHVADAAAGATQLFPRDRCACGRCCNWYRCSDKTPPTSTATRAECRWQLAETARRHTRTGSDTSPTRLNKGRMLVMLKLKVFI